MRKNFLDEIATVDQAGAGSLANAPFVNLTNYVKQYNDMISA